MNIQAWENRQWFERIMALKEQHEDKEGAAA